MKFSRLKSIAKLYIFLGMLIDFSRSTYNSRREIEEINKLFGINTNSIRTREIEERNTLFGRVSSQHTNNPSRSDPYSNQNVTFYTNNNTICLNGINTLKKEDIEYISKF